MFPVQIILGPMSNLATDDIIKYIKKHPKKPKNQELARSWRCAQHRLLRHGDHCRPALGTFVKVGLDGRRYENRSIFFPWCQGQRKRIQFQNVHFWLLENRLVSSALFQGSASKTSTFIETTWKITSSASTFHFSVTSSSEDKFNLNNGKTFFKNHVFSVFRVHKMT